MYNQSETQKRLGFRIHALSFVVTMVVLFVINFFTGSPYWAFWVLPGWTIGLFCHWYFALGRGVRSTL